MAGKTGPTLGQMNVVVRDVATSIAFYKRLGLAIEEATRPEWARHHATAVFPNGTRLELDSEPFAQQWNPGWKGRSAGSGGGVLFFTVDAREDVDRIYADLVAAGYASQQPASDAFWGARYAIVEDPDGNAIGLMSPIDPARRTPPVPPE